MKVLSFIKEEIKSLYIKITIKNLRHLIFILKCA